MPKYPFLLLLLSIFWTPAAAQQSADSFVLPAADTSVGEFPNVTVSTGEPSAAEAAAEAVPAADKALTLDECMRYAVEHSPAVDRKSVV